MLILMGNFEHFVVVSIVKIVYFGKFITRYFLFIRQFVWSDCVIDYDIGLNWFTGQSKTAIYFIIFTSMSVKSLIYRFNHYFLLVC